VFELLAIRGSRHLHGPICTKRTPLRPGQRTLRAGVHFSGTAPCRGRQERGICDSPAPPPLHPVPHPSSARRSDRASTGPLGVYPTHGQRSADQRPDADSDANASRRRRGSDRGRSGDPPRVSAGAAGTGPAPGSVPSRYEAVGRAGRMKNGRPPLGVDGHSLCVRLVRRGYRSTRRRLRSRSRRAARPNRRPLRLCCRSTRKPCQRPERAG